MCYNMPVLKVPDFSSTYNCTLMKKDCKLTLLGHVIEENIYYKLSS